MDRGAPPPERRRWARRQRLSAIQLRSACAATAPGFARRDLVEVERGDQSLLVGAGFGDDLAARVGDEGALANAYARACCTLPTTSGTGVVTDHRILPLAWTRDADYAVAALAAAGDPEADELRLAHLRWLYAAERRDGAWGRAYLPNGRVKDPAFQLDQQCYPLLELAEALQRWPRERRLSPYIASAREVLRTLRARQAPSAPLFATEETPADDPLDLPYHFSSHMLLWYTPRRLADVLEHRDLARMADAVAPRRAGTSRCADANGRCTPMRSTWQEAAVCTTTPTTCRPPWRPTGASAPPTTRCGGRRWRPRAAPTTADGRPVAMEGWVRTTPRERGRSAMYRNLRTVTRWATASGSGW